MGQNLIDQRSGREATNNLLSLSFLSPNQLQIFLTPPYYFLCLFICPGSSKTSLADSGQYS